MLCCLSAAIVVTRTRHHATLYLHFLSYDSFSVDLDLCHTPVLFQRDFVCVWGGGGRGRLLNTVTGDISLCVVVT
jgi:hypothetical protein